MSIRAAASATGQVLAWLVAGLVVLVLAASVVIPKLAGATTYTILTGSMRPGMPPGTMVVVKPVKPEAIAIGDVITFQLRSGEPTVATHRVVAISATLGGERAFVTKGDANDGADPTPVRAVQVKGGAWYAIPYLGLPSLWLGVGTREVVVMGAVVVLLGYAIACFAGAAGDRRRRHAGVVDAEEAPELVEADR